MALSGARLLVAVDPEAACDDRARRLNGNVAETRKTNGDGGRAMHAARGKRDRMAKECGQEGAWNILRREFGDTFAQFCIDVGDAAVASMLLESM